MHVLALPPLPANASADQAEAWLAAFGEATAPTQAEEARVYRANAALFRGERDKAMHLALGVDADSPKRTCLMALADIAELHAQQQDADADRLDPLPF